MFGGLSIQYGGWRQSLRFGKCFIAIRKLHNHLTEVVPSFVTARSFLRNTKITTVTTTSSIIPIQKLGLPSLSQKQRRHHHHHHHYHHYHHQQQQQKQQFRSNWWSNNAVRLQWQWQCRNIHMNHLLYRTLSSSSCRCVNISSIMNKTGEFCMDEYDIIGFDLDGTLLRYNLNNMVILEYELLTKYLVQQKNYPTALLKKQFDLEFIQKGLILDTERGNVLKLASDGKILQCTHGTKLLSDQEIKYIYGENRQWDIAQGFIKDPLSTWNGPQSEKFRALLDYFDFVASLVFAQAVDLIDNINANQTNTKYTVWQDILCGLMHIYSRENYANGQSEYFEQLRNHTEHYLLRTESHVIQWLKDLRASGKALYLLTGSNIDFANLTASYALGQDWRNLFDCVICFAKKPGFFILERPFLKVDCQKLMEIPDSELKLNDDLEIGQTYTQGNWKQLRESLNKQLLFKDIEKLRCIYVGDNLLQDVYAPSSNGIDTIAISEELLEHNCDYAFSSIVQSKFWGSYFNIKECNTIWVEIFKKHSQLCVASVNELAKLPSALRDNISR